MLVLIHPNIHTYIHVLYKQSLVCMFRCVCQGYWRGKGGYGSGSWRVTKKVYFSVACPWSQGLSLYIYIYMHVYMYQALSIKVILSYSYVYISQVLHKSATIRHALKAQAAGVDLIEVVGYEASIAGGQPGGH